MSKPQSPIGTPGAEAALAASPVVRVQSARSRVVTALLGILCGIAIFLATIPPAHPGGLAGHPGFPPPHPWLLHALRFVTGVASPGVEAAPEAAESMPTGGIRN